MKEQVYDYLKTHTPKLCVLATSAEDKTEAALVGYAIEEDLTIIINTEQGSRKHNNMVKNKHVSVVFGFGFDEKNVQIDGTATLLEKGEIETKTEELYFSQNPEARKYKRVNTVFITIKPTWMRFFDLTVQPPKMEEEVVS